MDYAGNPAILSIGRDITVRKQLEEMHRKEYLDRLVMVFPIAILSLDRNQNILTVNRSAEELLGYESAELIDISISRLTANEDTLEFSDKKNFALDFVKKGGNQITMNVSTSVITENGTYAGLIATLQEMSGLRELFITPSKEEVIEEEIETESKLELEPGYMYLIDSEEVNTGYNAFSNIVKRGVSGLCITRRNPEKIRDLYGLSKTPIVWLTKNEIPGQPSIDPVDLFKVYPTIANFIEEVEDGVVMIEGLEYLIL